MSIFFLFFIFSCNDIKKKDEKRPSGNNQAANTMKTGKFPSGLHDSKSNGYVRNEIIVKFVNGTDQKTISVIHMD